MKINQEFIVPYSLAVGIFNLIFVSILILILSWIFNFHLTWRIFAEHYILGYAVLWILNLKSIEDKEI
jgi:hypothetical protein